MTDMMSLPSRERGLKFPVGRGLRLGRLVAPFTGAWIEITKIMRRQISGLVAPFTGAWIEITRRTTRAGGCRSLPSRERGLKC